jgi:hypothetical protein
LKLKAIDAVRCHFENGEALPEVRLGDFIFDSAKGGFTVPDDFNDLLPNRRPLLVNPS